MSRMQEVKLRFSKEEMEVLEPVLKDGTKIRQALSEFLKDQKTMQAEAARENTILDTAAGLVYGSRNQSYGHPKDNFGNIARLQNAYLAIVEDRGRQRGIEVIDYNESELSEIDVAIMNILQKCARLATNQHHIDSVVDIAGYAATIERVIKDK